MNSDGNWETLGSADFAQISSNSVSSDLYDSEISELKEQIEELQKTKKDKFNLRRFLWNLI